MQVLLLNLKECQKKKNLHWILKTWYTPEDIMAHGNKNNSNSNFNLAS